MRRRHLVAAAMLAAAGSRAALAQTRGLPVVGFLNSASAKTYSSNVEAFRAGLREIGFIEGESILIEYRWADNDYSSLPALAQDLVRRKVAVIAATGDLVSARAAQGATREIPIVFTVGSDPVPFGLVASLARPGGNSTGATLFSSTLSAKRMELLREVAPAVTQVALLMNPDNLNVAVDTRALQDAARSLGRRTVVMEARGPTELDGAFEAIRQSSAGAVVVASDPMFLGQRHRIIALAAQHRLPVMYWTRDFAEAGGLISYGTSIAWMYHQAGVYCGRILKGAKPGELPVVQPTTFELVINQKTARTLDIVIPRPLLLRADTVID